MEGVGGGEKNERMDLITSFQYTMQEKKISHFLSAVISNKRDNVVHVTERTKISPHLQKESCPI